MIFIIIFVDESHGRHRRLFNVMDTHRVPLSNISNTLLVGEGSSSIKVDQEKKKYHGSKRDKELSSTNSDLMQYNEGKLK